MNLEFQGGSGSVVGGLQRIDLFKAPEQVPSRIM